jgi:hypothetical protein
MIFWSSFSTDLEQTVSGRYRQAFFSCTTSQFNEGASGACRIVLLI